MAGLIIGVITALKIIVRSSFLLLQF